MGDEDGCAGNEDSSPDLFFGGWEGVDDGADADVDEGKDSVFGAGS